MCNTQKYKKMRSKFQFEKCI